MFMPNYSFLVLRVSELGCGQTEGRTDGRTDTWRNYKGGFLVGYGTLKTHPGTRR